MAVRAELGQIVDHCLEMSHPEKILFARDGVTKQELVDYY
jgi:DNA primase